MLSCVAGRILQHRRNREGKPFAVLSALSMALMLLGGCMVGPNHQRPAMAVPEQWLGASAPDADAASVATLQPAELMDWWRQFRDPLLTSLIERALAANLDLAQARARVREARAARRVVAAGFWPALDAAAAYQHSGTGSGGSQGNFASTAGAGGGERDLFQAGLDAAWELDLFGGVRRGIEASEADIRTAVEDRRDVLVSLVAEVGTNYVNLRGLQEQIVIARDNLKTQQHTAEITRKRYEAGFVSGLDVANANAQAATTQSQIPVLESAARATIYSLSLLLGREPGSLAPELAAAKAIPPVPPEVPVGLPSELLRRRPDIRRAEAQLHAATARIGVATADLFPKFSLTGSLGFAGSDLASFATWGSRSWSIGPGVSWPVFDAGRIRSNIEVQSAVQEQALLTYQKSVLTALKDVETALVAYAREQQHRQALAEAVSYNRKAVELAMKLYVAGKTDFLNVLSAQNALYASEDALAQSTSSLATNLIALYKALGGGWVEES